MSRRDARAFLRFVLITYGVFALLVGGGVYGCHLSERVDWPTRSDPLPELVAVAARTAGVAAGDAFVYDCWPEDRPGELWRIEAPPAVVDAQFAALQAAPVEHDWLQGCEVLPADFHDHAPLWWEPPRCAGHRVLVTAGFEHLLRGYGPDRALAFLYEPTERVLWAWVGSR